MRLSTERHLSRALPTDCWQQNDPKLFNYVRNDPFLESLHNEPGFWSVVADVESELAEIRAEYRASKGELAASL